jgi:C4-dicarboxylate-specific signal transduction histidine kinase
MVGFVQDITERKQAEEALHDQQAALAHASRVASIGELTSGIVHEISQPLYAVSNFSGACRRTLEGVKFEGSAEVADCLDRITQATTTAQEILVRLRGYLKRQDVQRFMVELSEAIEEVLKLLAFKIRSHGVTVDCDLAPETRVFADPVQLQQVLVNLILNACDALDTVPTEARHILIRAAIMDDEVEVSVEDNGIGISEEAAEHLFDPFFSTKAEGLGVGMAVTKGIISRHDGKIWFTSPPHKGTTFHFTLPVFQDQ